MEKSGELFSKRHHNMLKIKYRPSGNIIIETRNFFIKFPLRYWALKENLKEISNTREVNTDEHFSNYLPIYKSIWFVVITPKLIPISDIKIIEKYFKESFTEASIWIKKPFSEIIKTDNLYLFSQEIGIESWLKTIIKNLTIPVSSIHGDTHIENILLDNNRLIKLIDWTRYNKYASRYFDLIDFEVFYKKNEKEMWFLSWSNLYKNCNSIFSIPVSSEYFISYVLWKINEELTTLVLRKKLGQEKKLKYKKLLFTLKDLIHE